MKNLTILGSAILLIAVAGCEPAHQADERREFNVALAQWFNDTALKNALIVQHTLFPYHFVENSAALNELGQRDLALLAAHFQEAPGPLNVRRGEAPDDLYKARMDTVTKFLADAGVDAQRLTVSDALPGGDGANSERVLKIAEETDKTRGTRAVRGTTPRTTTTGVTSSFITGGR